MAPRGGRGPERGRGILQPDERKTHTQYVFLLVYLLLFVYSPLMLLTPAQKTKLTAMMARRGSRRLDTKEIVALYLDGVRSVEIAERLGCSYQTVLNHLRKARDER